MAGEENFDQNRKIRVLVVDDHQVVRKGLALVLAIEPDIEICCEAGSGMEAIRLANQLNPNVILMDMKMPGMDGIEAARIIKANLPDCKILILTGISSDDSIFEAIENGIDGYILKEVTPDEMIKAIRIVASGEAYLHPTVTRKVLAKISSNKNSLTSNTNQVKSANIELHPNSFATAADYNNKEQNETLSEREREVLQGVAVGRSNREIAESLVVGEETVRTHLKSAFRKLNVNDRTQAVVVALKQGLIQL